MDDGVKAQPLLKKNKSYGDLQTGGISQKVSKPSCVNRQRQICAREGAIFFLLFDDSIPHSFRKPDPEKPSRFDTNLSYDDYRSADQPTGRDRFVGRVPQLEQPFLLMVVRRGGGRTDRRTRTDGRGGVGKDTLLDPSIDMKEMTDDLPARVRGCASRGRRQMIMEFPSPIDAS